MFVELKPTETFLRGIRHAQSIRMVRRGTTIISPRKRGSCSLHIPICYNTVTPQAGLVIAGTSPFPIFEESSLEQFLDVLR